MVDDVVCGPAEKMGIRACRFCGYAGSNDCPIAERVDNLILENEELKEQVKEHQSTIDRLQEE